MAKIRAYKLAEELKLEREEFLEKVRALGIELRSAMSSVDVDQAEEIRAQLGAAVTEERVDNRASGGTVIRRRRKVVRREPEAPGVAEAEPSAEAAEPVSVPAPAPAEPEPLVAAEPEPAAAEPEPPAPEPGLVAEPIAASAPEATEVGAGAAAPAAPAGAPAPADARPGFGRAGPTRRPVRRTHQEQVILKEQEGMARTMLGNVQHRLEQRRLIVEQQARAQPRRRRTARGRKAPAPVGPRQKILRVSGEMSLPELSGETGVKVRDLLRRVRGLGAEVDRDDLLDLETITLLAAELGFEVKEQIKNVEQQVEAVAESRGEDLEPRSAVVTVMGHVDHGKTSLLDTIRKSNVVAGEAGGITQHIGAYKVHAGGGEVTFLDTPGHAAFTQMRARGAQATDLVVLVVAADDGVMPQTVEAIDHARAAGVPIVVAINKIDRPDADPMKVKRELLEHEIVLEEFGGETIGVEVSATQGTHVEQLIELLALQAEVLELRARSCGPARGVVVEAQLDRGRGPLATLLVQEGLLKRGDALVVGQVSGRVRTLANETSEMLKEAGPSTPVQVIGLAGVPEAGDTFTVVASEREAKAVAEHRIAELKRAAVGEAAGPAPSEDIFTAMEEEGDRKELRLVLKADVRGTLEAICDAAEKLSTERVGLSVIHAGVGGISERDVMLAAASKALVLGFHVRPEASARKTAEREGVDIRTFDIVYELLDDVTALMTGLLPPRVVERVSGHAEVRRLFTLPRRGTAAGCLVPEGTIRRSDQVRVVRDGIPVYTGTIGSLRHYKDDVREIQAGNECGIRIEGYDDVKVGDVIESFSIEEVPETL